MIMCGEAGVRRARPRAGRAPAGRGRRAARRAARPGRGRGTRRSTRDGGGGVTRSNGWGRVSERVRGARPRVVVRWDSPLPDSAARRASASRRRADRPRLAPSAGRRRASSGRPVPLAPRGGSALCPRPGPCASRASGPAGERGRASPSPRRGSRVPAAAVPAPNTHSPHLWARGSRSPRPGTSLSLRFRHGASPPRPRAPQRAPPAPPSPRGGSPSPPAAPPRSAAPAARDG